MAQELMKPSEKELLLNLIARHRAVIYGQRATNFHLPTNLRKETKDYDILTSKPKSKAEELVKELNKYYPNKYEVIPAKYKKTFKIKNRETGETFSDFTGTTRLPESYNELGIRRASLKYSEKKLKKSIKNPASSFRHEKDRDTLNKIKQGKRRW